MKTNEKTLSLPLGFCSECIEHFQTGNLGGFGMTFEGLAKPAQGRAGGVVELDATYCEHNNAGALRSVCGDAQLGPWRIFCPISLQAFDAIFKRTARHLAEHGEVMNEAQALEGTFNQLMSRIAPGGNA